VTVQARIWFRLGVRYEGRVARHSRSGTRGLFRDADGRWRIDLRWREPGTGVARRYCERLPAGLSAAAAKQRARALLDAALAGGFEPRATAGRRLHAALDEYVAWCEVNREASVVRRKAICARLRAGIPDMPLREVTALHAERFKKERLATGVAPATVNRDLEVLSHFFSMTARWGWLDEAATRALRAVTHLKEPPGRVRYLTNEEEKRLLGALPVRARRIVVAALLSGMRQGELLGLQKSAVDLAAAVVTLTRTKSNKVRRIPVNDGLAAVLREAMNDSDGSLVFVTRAGSPYTADGVRSIFRRAVRKAGIVDFRFHDLRHTMATRLRQNGVGIDAIADLLGHSTLAMTRRYAHLGSETLKAAMATLPPPALGPASAFHPSGLPPRTAPPVEKARAPETDPA
jgi:integrase